MVDDDGRLTLHHELEDYDTFQLNTPPEAPASASAAGMGYGGEGGESEYPGMSPETSGGRGPRRGR